jgi:cytochrome c-type biogenesis protein CcmH/NrfF
MTVTAVLWIVALAIFLTTTKVIALAWRARRRQRETPEEQYLRAVRDLRSRPAPPENPWPSLFGSAG